MRNIKLTISYDGTQYHGWQIQKNGITIQEVIQNKLSTITNEQVKLIGASRTDARVHSIGQVANFHTDSHIDPSSLKKALNSLLPRDIVILSVEVVEKEFNARYSAHRKTYRYIIHNSETMLPFLRNYVW